MHILRSQNSSHLVYNCMVETITSAIEQSVFPLTAKGTRPCLKMENKNLWETSVLNILNLYKYTNKNLWEIYISLCHSNVAKLCFRNIARLLANWLSSILSIWTRIFFLACGNDKHFGSACKFKLHWAFSIYETTENAILWCQTPI